MIATDSPFDPRRSNRGEETVIDGHETHWYRGEIASAPDAQVRETLIELDDGRVAHISLRAASEAELADALQQAQRSEEHTSELQSLMRISYAVFCLQKKNINTTRKR